MDSFAVWYKAKQGRNTGDGQIDKKEENKEEANLDIHLNLWKVKCKKWDRENTTFLDIGLKIRNIEDIKSIYMYIPLKINKDDLKDLGSLMRNDLKLLNGIFNDTCSITSNEREDGISVKKGNEDIFIKTLDYEYQDNLKIRSTEDGSILIINVENEQNKEGKSTYYRFRIDGKCMEDFGAKKSPKYKLFRIEDIEDHIIDFRLNEKRALPEGLNMMIAKDSEFRIGTIHFLLLISSEYDVPTARSNYSVRALEGNLWDKYIPGNCNSDELLGYHWKERENDNLNAYIKIEVRKQNWFRVLQYIWGAGIIAITTNIVSQMLISNKWNVLSGIGWFFLGIGWIVIIVLLFIEFFNRSKIYKKILNKIKKHLRRK